MQFDAISPSVDSIALSEFPSPSVCALESDVPIADVPLRMGAPLQKAQGGSRAEALPMFTPPPRNDAHLLRGASYAPAGACGSVSLGSVLDSESTGSLLEGNKGNAASLEAESLASVCVSQVEVCEFEFGDLRCCRIQTVPMRKSMDWMTPAFLVPEHAEFCDTTSEPCDPLSYADVDAIALTRARVNTTREPATAHLDAVADPHAMVAAMVRGKAWAGLPMDYVVNDSMSRSISWRAAFEGIKRDESVASSFLS